LTVRPVVASRGELPLACEVALRLDDRLVQIARCPPRAPAHFPNLELHRVYTVTVRASGFKVSSQLAPIDGGDRVDDVLCLVSPRHALPTFPDISGLDRTLLVALERSDLLDDPKALRTLGERYQTLRPVEASRALPDRDDPKRELEPFHHAERRWKALSDEQRSGLLNLFAKTRSVRLLDGTTAWFHVRTLVEIQRDRIFALVTPTLAAKAMSRVEPTFDGASDVLHSPPPAFAKAGSVKSREAYGNLQLSFARHSSERLATLVDADVDDAAGIEHGEQVVRNWIGRGARKVLRGGANLPEDRTHPYDIHQILMFHQRGQDQRTPSISRIEPCYGLTVRNGPPGFQLGPEV
jgi:hypothetical protein